MQSQTEVLYVAISNESRLLKPSKKATTYLKRSCVSQGTKFSAKSGQKCEDVKLTTLYISEKSCYLFTLKYPQTCLHVTV